MQQVYRLERDTFLALKKQALAIMRGIPKNDLEAGMELGVRRTLDIIETGIVIEKDQ